MLDKHTPLCAGNWKAHGDNNLLENWASGMADALGEIVLFVPHPYIFTAARCLKKIAAVGSQDIATHGPANQTGNTTALHVADCGASWTLVGHSERRTMGESNQDLASKVKQADEAGLRIIFCVGETLDQRRSGELEKVLSDQLEGGLPDYLPEEIVIAYEPVWAIGTGVAASTDEAQQSCHLVRKLLIQRGANARILYGGSVKPDNASEIMLQDDIDGLLVGGASLDHESFSRIARSVSNSVK